MEPTPVRLVMISHVAPVPSTAGQRQRVRHTMEALGHRFDLTLVTSAGNLAAQPDIVDHADEVITVGDGDRSTVARVLNLAAGTAYSAATGLKRSNRDIQRLFAPAALAEVLDPAAFDLAFFHYWYAAASVPFFHRAGTPCVLDMHDVLWRARGSQLRERRFVPEAVAALQERRYRAREEAAWSQFAGVVAINEEERHDATAVVGDDVPVWYAPMGVHLERWPYGHEPADPPRLAYYGGLNTPARELAAEQCVGEIMPEVWARHPDCELWIVGANPTERVRRLGRHPRVRVTGFVDDPAAVLGSMWAVLCPFSGQFGFRSRLIEVMACGVPIVGTPDAVYGMGLTDDDSLELHPDSMGMARATNHILDDRAGALRRGRLARAQAERFGFDATYGRLADDLATFAAERDRSAPRNG